MLKKHLKSLNGIYKLKRASKWATKQFVADATDVAEGLEEGTSYVLWVAQSDFETKSGSQVTTGEWFIVEAK